MKKKPMLTLAINGKFLGQKFGRSGVHRVAYELTNAIDKLLSGDAILAAKISCFIVAAEEENYGLDLKSVEFRYSSRWLYKLNRVFWEQLIVPLMARRATLINFCNLGPLLYKNAYTMMHDAQVYASPASYSRAFRLWYGFVQPRLAKSNRGILTVSKFSRDELEKFEIVSSSRVCVIHNGCDHVLRLKAEMTIVKEANLRVGQYVVALANTQKHKNIGILFKAFDSDELRDIALALFGGASREDFEQLGYVVPPNVVFLGKISDEQLSGLMSEAIALAFPSLTEGFGLPPLEAMLLGCPVVAAPCGALVEVCGDAALWADPYAPEQWVQKIVQLYSDSSHAAAVSIAGRNHAAGYTWENSARCLLNFLLNENRKVKR